MTPKMNRRGRAVCALYLICLSLIAAAAPATAQRNARGARPRTARTSPSRPSARVLLIPLDDRPPCVQFVEMIGRIADAEVVAPPISTLGRFTEPGDPEAISRWTLGQDLRGFDALVVSLDMLAYGGLVNSRVFRTPPDVASRRIELIEEVRRRAPRLPIYGFNVIMRLAPTDSPRITAFRDRLARWAEISPYRDSDARLAAEVERLERDIPADALTDYKNSRARNLRINEASIRMVRRGVIDYLILSQDDAKPRGIHVADRERLISEVERLKLTDRVAVQPGADEVAMLLLSRALTRRFAYQPRIHALYSSDAARTMTAPFEDRPLNHTVSFHIAAAGGREVADAKNADILFFVHGSRHEPGVAPRFAEEVARAVEQGRRVIVADIDPKGDVQGADPAFTEELRRLSVLPRLTGYASWNTAGNTIGTALPHGIVYTLARERVVRDARARASRVADAQIEFLLHRLIDDYAYHSLVRPEAKAFAAERKLNPNGLTGADETAVEGFIRERMRPRVASLWRDFAGTTLYLRHGVLGPTFEPSDFSNFSINLPWGRTFEAAISFDVRIVPRGDAVRVLAPDPRL